MLSFAPRIVPALVFYLARIDDGTQPIAELNRRIGRRATVIGVTRPSYERVRTIAHALRRLRRTAAWRAELSVQTRVAVRVGRRRGGPDPATVIRLWPRRPRPAQALTG